MLAVSLTVTVGDDVAFELTVTNDGPDPVAVTFRDGIRADFAVYDADGEADTADSEVWRYSEGRMATQAISTAEFAPGESATFSETWADPTPGEYTAVGELRLAGDDEVRTETPFSV
ncbi:hypothetical protein BRC72_09760 [Halobacteriales archaeon QH_7_66_36]|nr:MAG: hypothetical protein BRC72_09760 [Halobacteriales archaeon QH_7_66_36]